MADTLNVVVTCTKQKRFPVDSDCQLRAIGRGTVSSRVREWRRRLSNRNRNRVSAEQLYAGDHWAMVRSFRSSHFNVDIWICSAGYGLINMKDKLTPYSATFSSPHADSVCHNVTDCNESEAPRIWWDRMAKWPSRASGRPRSLLELAQGFPNRGILMVASETYLKAIADDLRAAANTLSDRELLSIVSSGSRTLGGLTEHLVPCDARLQYVVNGARRSLNTRIASKIISESRNVPRLCTLKRKFQKLLAKQPEITRYDRTPLSDEEVRTFISTSLRKDASYTHTRLLRMLRDQGNACEQSRFAMLYREVREQCNGT